MAKKKQQLSVFSRKEAAIFLLIVCGTIGFGGYHFAQSLPSIAANVTTVMQNNEESLAAAVPYYAAKYDNMAWYCGTSSFADSNARCTNAEINNGEGYPAPLACNTIGDNGGSDDGNICSTRGKYNVYGVLSAYEVANPVNGYTNFFKGTSEGNRYRVIWNKPIRYFGNNTDTNPLVSYINQEYSNGVNTWFNYNMSKSSLASVSETTQESWSLGESVTTNGFTGTKTVKVPAHTAVRVQWNCQPWQITYFNDQSGLFGSGTSRIGHRLNFFDSAVTSNLGGSTARAGGVIVTPDTDKTYNVTCRSSAETFRWMQEGTNYDVDVRHTYPAKNGSGLSITVDTVPASEVDASVGATPKVTVGGKATITWKADWAYAATLSGPGITTTSCSNAAQCNGVKTLTTNALTQVGTSTYTLSYDAYNTSGTLITTTKTATVYVSQAPVTAPSCTLVAPSTSIPADAQTSFEYITNNAVSASIDRGAGAVTQLPSGIFLFYAPSDPTVDYLYTMTVSNSGGATATCSDTVFMQRDLCSNITDYQGVWPIPSDTGSVSGGTCSCDAGYQINGTGNSAQCVETVPDPVISIFDADPPRVQRNRSTTLSWTIDDPVSCSISGTDGFVYAISDGEGTVTGSVDTNPITQVTTFTLACTSGISVQKTVTVVPSVQEI